MSDANSPPFGVNVIGYLSSEKGLGEAARGLVRALRTTTIPDALHDFFVDGSVNRSMDLPVHRGGFPYSTNLIAVNVDNLPNLGRNIDLRAIRENRHSIGYWFWETERFPPEWQDRFDEVDEVWVGSHYTLDTISRISPVRVLRIPPSLNVQPTIQPITRAMLGLPADAFVFLFIFDAESRISRKNPIGLMRAFREAFPTDPQVRLIFKVSRLEGSPDREMFLAEAARDPRIHLYGGVIERAALTGLIAMSDCYVSLHRSEGFGLTMAEAMLLGKPVIATAYSGNIDFMTPHNSVLVDYTLTTLNEDDGPYKKGTTWADPNLSHAAEQLRRVYQNRSASLLLGQRARADILALCHPSVVGQRMAERLSVIHARRKHTRSIHRTTWQLDMDPLMQSRNWTVGEQSSVGVSVLPPNPYPASTDTRLIGEWQRLDGETPGDLTRIEIDLPGTQPPPAIPAVYRSIPLVAPSVAGQYRLSLTLTRDQQHLAGPIEVNARVVSPGSGKVTR